MTLLDGTTGDRAELARLFLGLARARNRGATRREHDLAQLEKRLGRYLGAKESRREEPRREESRREEPRSRKADAPPQSAEEQALAALIGGPVSNRRSQRARAIEDAAKSAPEQADAIASAALAHHVSDAGLAVPAPWLAGVVALARSQDAAPQLDATVERLAAQGARCLEIYDETPFAVLVDVLRSASDRDFGGLRRGVLAKEADESRRVWTVRLSKDGTERMLAVAPDVDSAWNAGLVEALVAKLRGLCAYIALSAPGEHNQALRDAAVALGITIAEDDLLGALDQATAAQPAEAPARQVAEKPSRAPSPTAVLRDLLTGDSEPSVNDLAAPLGALRRVGEAFAIARRSLSDAQLDDRLALLLDAVEQAQVPVSRTLEGTGVVLDAASRFPEGKVAAWLASEVGQARFGGPGLDQVVGVMAQLPQDQGWRVGTVLRGTTTRERKDDAVLAALGHNADALWRVVLRRQKDRKEIWVLTDLTPEARAAAVQLAGVEAPRLVLADGGELEAAKALPNGIVAGLDASAEALVSFFQE